MNALCDITESSQKVALVYRLLFAGALLCLLDPLNVRLSLAPGCRWRVGGLGAGTGTGVAVLMVVTARLNKKQIFGVEFFFFWLL